MKILIVDDDAVTRLVLLKALGRCGWEVLAVPDGQRAYDLLQMQDAPKIAIIDWEMPGLTGPELCRRLRKSARSHHVHIIMLSGRRSSEDMVTGLDAGADDFVGKPPNFDELQARVRAASRLVEQREQLNRKANTDLLTGILNRSAIQEVLRQTLIHYAQMTKPVSVLLADADRFKNVNDTYGHAAGDSVLRAIATRLGERLRPSDSVGRYGGEEFLIVLPGCHLEDALRVGKRVCNHVASGSIQTPAGPLFTTISLGAASAAGEAFDVETLINKADSGLYSAKRNGRNRVERSVEHTVDVTAAHASP